MGWASERAQAVFEALNGAFDGDGIMVAVTLRLFVRFTASGQIAILRVLAADEVAPW